MGFFDDKKKGNESLKTLSEKEIQSKLYGHIRNSDRMVQEDLPALSKPRLESQTFHNSNEALAKSVNASSGASAKVAAPDLFNKTQDPQAEVAPATNRTHEGLSGKSYESKVSLTPKAYGQKQTKPAQPKNNVLLPTFQKIAAFLGQILKQGFFKIAQFFANVISSGIRSLTAIDFRKPAVRRFFYSVAAVALLAFVFVGIHHLNKNREVAMKSPHKGPVVHLKKSKSKHPSEALESALTAGAVEPGDEETQSSAAADNAAPKIENKDLKSSTNKSDSATPGKSAAAVSKSHFKAMPINEEKKAKTVAPASKTGNRPAGTETKASEDILSYVIQVATYATQEDAEKLVGKFKADGFNSFFKSVSRSGGRVYYCIFIGKFKNHQDADNKLAEFKKKDVAKPFQDAFVRSI